MAVDGELNEGLRADLLREISTVGRYAVQSATVGNGPLAEALTDLAWDVLRRATDLARLIDPGEFPDGAQAEAAASWAWPAAGEAPEPFDIVAGDLRSAHLAIFAYRQRLARAGATDEPFVAGALATLLAGAEEERNRLGRLLHAVSSDRTAAGRPPVPA